MTAFLSRRTGRRVKGAASTPRKSSTDLLAALREARRSMQTLLDHLPGCAYRCRNDRDWTMEFCSNGMESLTGHPAEAFMEKALSYGWDIIHPDDAGGVWTAVQRAVRASRNFQLEYRIRHASGELRQVWEQGTGIRDSRGRLLALEGLIMDITPLKQAEDKLAQERNLLRSLIDNIPDLIAAKDTAGRYTLANRAVLDLFGVQREEEVIGKSLSDFIPDTGTVDDEDRVILEAGISIINDERPALHPKTPKRTYLTSKVPLKDGRQRIIGVVSIRRDISDIRNAMERIGRMNAELEVRVKERTRDLELVNQELKAFSYSVSHDLSAPLRHMRGFAEALARTASGKLDAEENRHLQRICTAALHMQQLIHDMLKLSKMTSHKLHCVTCDVSAMARAVAEEIRLGEPARKVEFRITAGLTAHADYNLLRIALTNLLQNAWKFTGRAARPVIEVGAHHEGQEQVFFVRDNGAGFDMKQAKRLFTAFRRLHPQEEFPGSGIGLTIVDRIVGRHGGRIWASAQPGRGATFYFTLETTQDAQFRKPATAF